MNSKSLQIGPQQIAYYESHGDGPAALLVPGNSFSGQTFRHQLQGPFGQKHRLVAIDLPGHGESAPAVDPPNDYTLPGYARLVRAVAEQLGLERAVVVGWSLGGHVVLEASALLPDAAGLMIFGTPPVGDPSTMADAFLPNPAMAAAFKAELTEAEIDGFAAACFKPGQHPIPQLFPADIARTDGLARQTIGASIQPGGYRDEVEVVANLTVPLAVLHGEHDQLVNLAYINTLTMPTLWRGAVQVIPDASHTPHWEQPEQFNALLEAFLRDCAA
jgi:pimeloyl-ACP methyl ester carboxylesterase